MVGTSEQFQYILRDESMHANFGIDLIYFVVNDEEFFALQKQDPKHQI